jgi:hypothetical protein
MSLFFPYGKAIASALRMSKFTHHLRNATIIAASMIVPATLATTGLYAADRNWHDEGHKDDHTWNSHEDKAYGMWEKEQHRKHTNFEKLKVEDQQNYWNWRHEHMDVQLHINL